MYYFKKTLQTQYQKEIGETICVIQLELLCL